MLTEHRDALLGEALVVSAQGRRDRKELAHQLSKVGFDVTLPGDVKTAWVYLQGWPYIRTELPRVVVIDASALSSAGRALFTRLVAQSRRLRFPLVVLVGADPLDGVIPGMVVVPLPCCCLQVTVRVLRAVGLCEARTREILLREQCWAKVGPDAWLSGAWQNEMASVGSSTGT